MAIICAWCNRYIRGEKPTEEEINHEMSRLAHGTCSACRARRSWGENPTLVLGRAQADFFPAIADLLQGAPEIRLEVERRFNARRVKENAAVSKERRDRLDRRL